MTLLGAIVKQVDAESGGYEGGVWSNRQALIYGELCSNPLTETVDSCQPGAVGCRTSEIWKPTI